MLYNSILSFGAFVYRLGRKILKLGHNCMNICRQCSKEFVQKHNTSGKYCSRSCSAKVNNRLHPKRYNPKKNRNCLNCRKFLLDYQIKFCCKECVGIYKRTALVENWINGKESGSNKYGVLRYIFRKFLIDQAGNKCSECGWNTPNPKIGKPILTVDHIDGNWTNNSYENLKVLCYNCHTLTETFGALNKNDLFENRIGTFRTKRDSSRD